MRILIYKRTHVGDPDSNGCFGAYDCMKSVRARAFDAVIGIGGTSAEPRHYNINGKVTWVGINAKKRFVHGKPWPVVEFAPNDFRILDSGGPYLRTFSHRLTTRFYGKKARTLMVDPTSPEYRDAIRIIRAVRHFPQTSPGQHSNCTNGRCTPKHVC